MSCEEEEEDFNNISEDSDDLSPTEKIILERIKIFKNEKDAVRILLSDHFREFRVGFFSKIKMTHQSVYQAIKREIRNCLNPFRIFLNEKDRENEEKELKNLYEELKRYFKVKNFNNTFFINYFKDLKKAHSKNLNSRYINMLPKNEEETLNDIHRKVSMIKSLKTYLLETVVDRMQQINLDKNHEIGDKDEFTIKYKYLVIKREIFSELTENDLIKYISNQQGSLKLRRALKDSSTYNYIPILCKGHCKQEADLFIQSLEKEIFINHIDCKKCENLKNNFNNVKSQIKSLYIKTCIFSHNINEVMFHPLFFLSFQNKFYISELKKENSNIYINSIIETSKIPNKYFGITSYKIRKIYDETETSMKEIIKLLKEYSIKSNLFGDYCFYPNYKTKKCPLDFFKPNKNDLKNHMIKCPFYHSDLEKRRILKIPKNKICPKALNNKEWVTDINKIHCENGDFCDKFHTRNELFYDERNFRKIYPCTEYNEKNKDDNDDISNFCKKFDMCPKKHPTDMKLEEIYLTADKKSDLQRDLMRLKEKEKNLRKKIEKMKKIECRLCFNYINGEDNREFIFFVNCNHIICSSCYENCKLCPFCDLKSEQEIKKINLKLNDEEKEEKEDKEEEDEESEESEDSENSSNSKENISSIKNEEDDDINDIDCGDLIQPNDNKDLSVSYFSKKDAELMDKYDSNNDDKEDKKNKNDKDESSIYQLSSSYSNNDSQENIRGRGRGRWGMRGRGGEIRGRGREINIRSRGNGVRTRGRGRGRRGYY